MVGLKIIFTLLRSMLDSPARFFFSGLIAQKYGSFQVHKTRLYVNQKTILNGISHFFYATRKCI